MEIQRAKGCERISFNSEAPGFLFLRPDSKSILLEDRNRMPMNQHLGNLLTEYLLLTAYSLRHQTGKIESSVFPLVSIRQPDGGTTAKQLVRKRITDCDTLHHQLRTFKEVCVTNMVLLATFSCYSKSPAQWVYAVLRANKDAILLAQKNIDEHEHRIRLLQVQHERLETEATNVRRSMDTATGAAGPPVLQRHSGLPPRGSRPSHRQTRHDLQMRPSTARCFQEP